MCGAATGPDFLLSHLDKSGLGGTFLNSDWISAVPFLCQQFKMTKKKLSPSTSQYENNALASIVQADEREGGFRLCSGTSLWLHYRSVAVTQ